MVTLLGLDAPIYQSLPLPAACTSATITVKQHEARLATEDTVAPVPGVPLSVGSAPHMAASPVIQSQYGAHGRTFIPIASSQSLFTMLRTDKLLRNRRIISTHRRGAEMKPLSLTIRINCLFSRSVVRLLRPQRLR